MIERLTETDLSEEGVPFRERETNLFETLKVLGRAIVSTFGGRCEVVIHDLSNPESSIVWIEGSVTGRSVGGSVTDLLLKELRHGKRDRILNYGGYSDGKALKSSTVLFRQDGKLHTAFCINFDVSELIAAEFSLRSFCTVTNDEETETFGPDVREMLEAVIAEACYEIGVPASSMDRSEKVRLVHMLEQRGAFEIRKAVSLVASRLGVSRYSVYNYLNETRAATRLQDTTSEGETNRA